MPPEKKKLGANSFQTQQLPRVDFVYTATETGREQKLKKKILSIGKVVCERS